MLLPNLHVRENQILQQNKILIGGQTINLRARQLVYVLAAFMNKETPTAEVAVSAKDFLDFVNKDAKQKWSDIYKLTSEIFDHLNDNPILIKKPRGKDYIKINWLSSLGVSQGMVRARFSVDIAEYFVYKQGLPYTKLLWDLRAYKSGFTARILDLFQRFHIKEHGEVELQFEYDLDQLKLFFGVHDKYPRMYDFDKRVLQVAKTELAENDRAPYWFEYKKIKEGRSVSKIAFEVHVRSKALLELAPELELIKSTHTNQKSLFEEQQRLSTEKEALVSLLTEEQGLKHDFAYRVVLNFTESQGRGYHELLKYGVNRNLAFTIVEKRCSFGEIIGYEDKYIKHSLMLLEEARIKRIEEAKRNPAKKKRTTPKEKRGGLAKNVFEKRLYFSSFMEKLSQSRKGQGHRKNSNRADLTSIGKIIRTMNSQKKY